MCTFTMGFLIKPSRPRLLISSTWLQLSDCSLAVMAELLVYRTCNDYCFSLCGECMAVSNQPFIFLIHPHLPTTLPSLFNLKSPAFCVLMNCCSSRCSLPGKGGDKEKALQSFSHLYFQSLQLSHHLNRQ